MKEIRIARRVIGTYIEKVGTQRVDVLHHYIDTSLREIVLQALTCFLVTALHTYNARHP
jgi:hypothetical protein